MIFELLEKIAEIIDAPFYSVDVIQRADGEFRVVEIGDGQVSDKKMWNVKDISKMLIENA
jgi:glutathione synthase/RimK-type ligase-like ATP-grasp enzyme